MRKLSMFAVALALTAFVACSEKKDKTDDMEGEDMTEQVQEGASETMTAAEETTTDAAETVTETATETTEAAH